LLISESVAASTVGITTRSIIRAVKAFFTEGSLLTSVNF
jgi:hypothetical protein